MLKITTRLQKLIWLVDFKKRKKYVQPYINQYSGRCCVLANGPSLKDALVKYDAGELEISSDSVMVNLAALDDHFWKIKPKHMCFSDILFCKDCGPRKEQVRKQFDLLQNKVDWDINLYLCFTSHRDIDEFINYSRITNPKVHFMPMNEIYVEKYPVKYWERLLSSGECMPHKGTVGNVALHVALLCGYKEIELYGVDQNWFLNFYMADDNHLNVVETHFYDKEGDRKMKPFYSAYSNDNKRISECMESLCLQFRCHEIHAWWAKRIGAHILNCTPDSMIDSFDRIGRDGEIHKCPYNVNDMISNWEPYYN